MKKLIWLILTLVCVSGLAGCSSVVDQEKWDLIPMVMVDGVLYLDTGYNNTDIRKCGTPDGEITSEVDGSEKPTADNQSNFGTGYGYQYGAAEGTIEVCMNGKWRIFATEEVRQKMQFPEQGAGVENEGQNDGAAADDAVDVSAEDIITDVAQPRLTMRTLKALVVRCGENLTWADFDTYYSQEVGSGLYILRYPIDMDYYLLIGGGSTEEPPMYIRLVSEYDINSRIDVRTEDIDVFLSRTPQTAEFSYTEVLNTYKENDPGVKYNGFVNSSRVAIETVRNAIERAKNECTVAYDAVNVAYDSTEYIWKITFYKAWTVGGDQTVYMDRYGVTCLIVYGE